MKERLLSNLFITLLMTTLPICGQERSQELLHCSRDSTKHSLNILGFFPCRLDGTHSNTTSCDYRTLPAVQLALEEINSKSDLLSCFELKLTQLYTTDLLQSSISRYQIITNGQLNQTYHGVLGPYNDEIALDLNYIFARLFKVIQMSYSVTDSELNNSTRYPRVYATVPTDIFLNQARKAVLDRFQWKTVAIFSSSSGNNAHRAQDLNRLLKRDTRYRAHMFGVYKDSAQEILNMAKNNDSRIFLPFISGTEARQMFCEAYHTGLTTSDHVWILPGIYDPKWWYLDDDQLANNTLYNDCTNKQMKDIIRSTFFVDTLPFNVGARKDAIDVISSILNKTNEQPINNLNTTYPSTILHSKLLNVYDALHIMALTWNATITKLVNNKTYNTQDILDVINTPNNSTVLMELLEDSLIKAVSPYRGFTLFDGVFNRSLYGNALISQISLNQQNELEETIFAIFNSTSNISAMLHICNDELACGLTWKGGYQPSDGTGATSFQIGFFIFSFIFFPLIIIAGLVFAILTCVWRNNKYFKATTVLFTIILNLLCSGLATAGLMYITAGFIGYVQKNKSPVLPPLCATSYVTIETCFVAIMATVLVKNWRIYRIFHNPYNKNRRFLSTWTLSLAVLFIVLPLTIVLTIHYSLYPPAISNCPESTLEVDCVCRRLGTNLKWSLTSVIYFTVIMIMLITLGVLNLRIESFFRIEGELAAVVTFFSAMTGVSITVIHFTPSTFFVTVSGVNVLLMITSIAFLISINIPKINLMRKQNIERRRSAATLTKISSDYLEKCKEIANLKEHLYELNLLIEEFKIQFKDTNV